MVSGKGKYVFVCDWETGAAEKSLQLFGGAVRLRLPTVVRKSAKKLGSRTEYSNCAIMLQVAMPAKNDQKLKYETWS